jgi:hypothetical protein
MPACAEVRMLCDLHRKLLYPAASIPFACIPRPYESLLRDSFRGAGSGAVRPL